MLGNIKYRFSARRRVTKLDSSGFTQPVRNGQAGFTLVELNLSLVIIGIVTVSLLTILTNFLVLITRNNALMDMTVDSQGLLRTAAEELRYGAGVRVNNAITDANEPTGGWSTSNSDFVIIIAVPAENSDGNYIIDTDTGSPYLNELVYFRDGSTMYKRILAHPDATDNTLRTSCPASSSSPSCPPDRKLVDTAQSMTFTLYDQDNATTTDPLLARSLRIHLALVKDTFGTPISIDNSIRITLRNVF